MKKPVIFICHSSVDKEFVRNLVNRLNADGIQTWFDEVEIRIGESIHQKVNDGLNKSDFFVVVLSRASVKSRWVQEELSSASSIEKYSDKGIFILPLLLEECDVPPLLLDRRYANFKDDPESAYKELTDSIYQFFKSRHPETAPPQLGIPEIDENFIYDLADNPNKFLELSPRQFEEVVAFTLSKLGYSVSVTPLAIDGGYDLIATHPSLPGLSQQRFLIQCKRYSRPIGTAEVRALLGTLMLSGLDRAIFVTTSYFTVAAQKIVAGHPIELIDSDKLALWIKATLKADWTKPR